MKKFVLFLANISFMVCLAEGRIVAAIDESWVCGVKRSCLECLRLPQCTWCPESNTCFSKSLPGREDYCKDNATLYVDYGLSFEGNAKCTCIRDELEQNCYPPGVTEGPECSGRGRCECGRCVCYTTPDPDHVNKVIVGEYCEFDNFSCDGPHCNEGPYHIQQQYDQQLENGEIVVIPTD